MDLGDETVSSSRPGHCSPSLPEPPCAHCAERTYLKTLVAELLYKNQVLRFDLQNANEQLAKAESDHGNAFLRTNWF